MPARFQMLSALQAVNGVLLFGISTAFLFAVIQVQWRLLSHRHETVNDRTQSTELHGGAIDLQSPRSLQVDHPRSEDDVLQRSSLTVDYDPQQADREEHTADRSQQSNEQAHAL